MWRKRIIGWLCAVLMVPAAALGQEHGSAVAEFSQACTPEKLQAVANTAEAALTISEIRNIITGEKIPGGAKFVPSSATLPAFCKVSGSFVTNKKTGKTANFLATFPENWNGKYLQYGCFGTCGFFWFNDASSPNVDIIAQGAPGDALRKGYASFSTDEGHQTHEVVSWAENGPGNVNQEAIDDYLYRATEALAPVAKKLTSAFYSSLSGQSRNIERSYFAGCSGGGRNALVAASTFANEFDGFISGSPAMDLVGMSFHSSAFALATRRDGYTDISPAQVEVLNKVVNAKCDGLDGSEDGLIQNPAACDFLPEHDLPQCDLSKANEGCFTRAQVEALSVLVSSVVNERGELVYPGLAISNLALSKKKMVSEGIRAEGLLRVLMFGNAVDFDLNTLIRLIPDEKGVSLRAEVNSADVEEARKAMGAGVVDSPTQFDEVFRQNRKLMIWHDLSDNTLTPYETINFYARLAERHDGYDSLQNNVKLFMLPGTGHCSGGFGGVGPNSFDALTAMERWVEEAKEPNALVATYYPGTEFGKDFSRSSGRSMPLCKFPQMAKFNGQGDINDSVNWRCADTDQSMLRMGKSGARAGVVLQH